MGLGRALRPGDAEDGLGVDSNGLGPHPWMQVYRHAVMRRDAGTHVVAASESAAEQVLQSQVRNGRSSPSLWILFAAG